MPLTDLPSIQSKLFESLESVGPFEECALLGYPEHHNVGDHLIWLGAVRWILGVRRARVAYLSSIGEYSQRRLNAALSAGPIFLTGGGNFGDHWLRDQRFREKIVRRNPRRPVVVLPQSLYFSTPLSAEPARRIFNAHSDLTLFTRDDVSHDKAKRFFPQCKVRLAPDMCFALVDLAEPARRPSGSRPAAMLWLQRRDRERAFDFSGRPTPASWSVSDWPWMNGWTRLLQRVVRRAPWTLRFSQAFIHETASTPEGRALAASFFQSVCEAPSPELQRRSVRMAARAADFLNAHRLVATDRLHGFLFSAMLGIPAVLMPNVYHKNEAFFRAWMTRVPLCRYAEGPAEVEAVAREVLGKDVFGV